MSNVPPRRPADRRLPLRWAVILSTSTGAGLLAGQAAGAVAGVTVALAVAGLLHRTVD
jgi:hypothetical protein